MHRRPLLLPHDAVRAPVTWGVGCNTTVARLSTCSRRAGSHFRCEPRDTSQYDVTRLRRANLTQVLCTHLAISKFTRSTARQRTVAWRSLSWVWISLPSPLSSSTPPPPAAATRRVLAGQRFALRAAEPGQHQAVGVLDPLVQEVRWNRAVELDGVPVALVQVVTSRH